MQPSRLSQMNGKVRDKVSAISAGLVLSMLIKFKIKWDFSENTKCQFSTGVSPNLNEKLGRVSLSNNNWYPIEKLVSTESFAINLWGYDPKGSEISYMYSDLPGDLTTLHHCKILIDTLIQSNLFLVIILTYHNHVVYPQRNFTVLIEN